MSQDPILILSELASAMRANAALMEEMEFTPNVARAFVRQQAEAIACVADLFGCYLATTRVSVDELVAERFGTPMEATA